MPKTFPNRDVAAKERSDLAFNIWVALKITGQDDNKFDSGDEIIFYGEGTDKVFFQQETACSPMKTISYKRRQLLFSPRWQRCR